MDSVEQAAEGEAGAAVAEQEEALAEMAEVAVQAAMEEWRTAAGSSSHCHRASGRHPEA